MAKTQLTPKAKEVRDLKRAQPQMDAHELAAVLDVAEGTVYSYLQNLRALGQLPAGNSATKPARKPARKSPQRRARDDAAIAQPELPTPPAPAVTIEAHIGAELEAIESRLGEIATLESELTVERGKLLDTQRRYKAAQAALDEHDLTPDPIVADETTASEAPQPALA